MSNKDQTPSTATTGFFQPRPHVKNAFLEDAALRRAFALFLPERFQSSVASELTRWGDVVLSRQVTEWVADGEAHPPVLQLRDTYGRPLNRLLTSEGYRQLQNLGLREGAVAAGYECDHGRFARVVQFLKLAIWVPSSSTVTCPSAMQDGAAALLRSHLQNSSKEPAEATAVLQSAFDHLTSREIGFAWTSGQWMTERTGGSDVSGTETRARRLSQTQEEGQPQYVASDGSQLGPWVVDGFKWFSSATDADMTVLLAKTPGKDKLSCFFAPTRMRKRDGILPSIPGPDPRANTELNGIHPQRLKNKLGTKSMPTAELELKGMRAYMIGEEGQGVKQISTVLTLTRLHNAISAVGYLGRGLAVARAYADVRKVAGGQLLRDMPAHVKTLAHWHCEYRGSLMLAMFLPYCLGITEDTNGQPLESELLVSSDQARKLLRVLTPVSKALTALTSVAGLRMCMESMGGLGYLENEDAELNLARIFRDANVLPIWEGTTNIMAGDVLRVLKGRDADAVFETLSSWIQHIQKATNMSLKEVSKTLAALQKAVIEDPADQSVYNGVQHMETLGWTIMTCLLSVDASRGNDPASVEVARRWLAKRDQAVAASLDARPLVAKISADMDVVFGAEASRQTQASRL